MWKWINMEIGGNKRDFDKKRILQKIQGQNMCFNLGVVAAPHVRLLSLISVSVPECHEFPSDECMFWETHHTVKPFFLIQLYFI